MLAAGIWFGMLLFAMEVMRWYALGRLISYTATLVTLIAILYLFEKVVLLDRRAFTCKECGYDLQGLPDNRCPECGTAFDPTERDRTLARIASPPPMPRHRWVAVIVAVLLVLIVVASLPIYRQASTPTTAPNL